MTSAEVGTSGTHGNVSEAAPSVQGMDHGIPGIPGAPDSSAESLAVAPQVAAPLDRLRPARERRTSEASKTRRPMVSKSVVEEQERLLAEHLAHLGALDTQLMAAQRMSAAISTTHAETTRDDLSSDEVRTFTERWSEQILDLCLDAGVTASEVRRALVTGELPDGGIITALAEMRARRP